MSKPLHDRFDDVPRTSGRVGAHRAEAPGMNGLVVLLWSTAIALVLIVGGIFVSLVMMGRITLFPESAPAQSQEPTVQPTLDTSYRVMVFNATRDQALADEVRQSLLVQGWVEGDVPVVDADSEFDTTRVFYVEDADEAAALGIAELLGDAEVEKSDAYAALNVTDRPQLTVVLGLDRLAGAEGEGDAPEE